jgi:hypothetical protein
MTTRTQAALRKLIADTTTAPTMRRAATLRLSRLRAATTLAATTRAKPTAPAAPSEKAVYEAVQSFHALSRQRTALYRRRSTTREQTIFNAMTALMPAAVPTSSDPNEWRDFIAQVGGILEEIKNVRPL